MKNLLYISLYLVLNLISSYSHAQLISISGNIKNESTGKLIPDVDVYESISGVGTIANKQGFFKLMLKKGDKTIRFSETGFSNQIAKLNLQNDTIINVILTESKKMDIKEYGNMSNKYENEIIRKKRKVKSLIYQE